MASILRTKPPFFESMMTPTLTFFFLMLPLASLYSPICAFNSYRRAIFFLHRFHDRLQGEDFRLVILNDLGEDRDNLRHFEYHQRSLLWIGRDRSRREVRQHQIARRLHDRPINLEEFFAPLDAVTRQTVTHAFSFLRRAARGGSISGTT